jgi:hypothetical protein
VRYEENLLMKMNSVIVSLWGKETDAVSMPTRERGSDATYDVDGAAGIAETLSCRGKQAT